jgi:hypothetical protein
METTVVKHAIIVNTKVVTKYLVYVNTTVDLDGRVTNVIKVLNFVIYIIHRTFNLRDTNVGISIILVLLKISSEYFFLKDKIRELLIYWLNSLNKM